MAAWAIVSKVLETGLKLGAMDATKDASRFVSQARKLRNQQISIENERKVREFIRRAQQQRAAVLAEGTAMGGNANVSSTVQGALGSIRTKAATELDIFSDLDFLGEEIAHKENQAQGEINRANELNMWADIIGGSGSIFGGGMGGSSS